MAEAEAEATFTQFSCVAMVVCLAAHDHDDDDSASSVGADSNGDNDDANDQGECANDGRRALRSSVVIHRGNTPVVFPASSPASSLAGNGDYPAPYSVVSREAVRHLIQLGAEWLVNNVQANGRMTYKYWPSVPGESSSNNMIRQWMVGAPCMTIPQ